MKKSTMSKASAEPLPGQPKKESEKLLGAQAKTTLKSEGLEHFTEHPPKMKKQAPKLREHQLEQQQSKHPQKEDGTKTIQEHHNTHGPQVPPSVPPKKGDFENGEVLVSALEKQGVFDTMEGLQNRRAILTSLEEILSGWADSLRPVRNVATVGKVDGQEKRLREPRSRVALISFGSYRMGVHKPGADVDCLALSPPHCTRGDFFTSLVRILGTNERVSRLHPVPGAYTPVIKLHMDGVPVDLVFARLVDARKLQVIDDSVGSSSADTKSATYATSSRSRSPIPREEFELDDNDLIGLDEAGVRSLNGVRVAQMILNSMPHLKTFRLTLRVVKEWALVHGLYSNVLGFLGGVNWAILVAWICKRYPDASVPTLLSHFFETFSRWKWPKPVRLVETENEPPKGVMGMSVWNPEKNVRDAAHIMPIVTPAYPSMNSSYNVGLPQLRRIQQEMTRGREIIAAIQSSAKTWGDLFRGNAFFRQHVHYLQVNVSARNEKDFRAWFGLCESKLRILIVGLESPDYGVQAFPFAKIFHRTIPARNDPAQTRVHGRDQSSRLMASFFIALRFAGGIETVDLKSCTDEFLYKVNEWEDRRFGMDLTIEHVLQRHLPPFVFHEEVQETSDHAQERRQPKYAPSNVNKSGNTPHDGTKKVDNGACVEGKEPNRSAHPSPYKRARRRSPQPTPEI